MNLLSGPGAAAVVMMGTAKERCRATGTCGVPIDWNDPWAWVWVGTMTILGLIMVGLVMQPMFGKHKRNI